MRSSIHPRALLRKVLSRNQRQRLRNWQHKIRQMRYRKRISRDDLADALRRLGSWEGRIVWIQSSWNEFYNVDMKPTEVLDLFFELAGPRGTIVMPAFPVYKDPAAPLRVETAPVITGLLPELLRRHRSAHRSIHIRSSVVAVGPDAAWIVEGHENTAYPWGRGSPYDKLRERDALLVSLGFVSVGLTPLHMVQCIMHEEDPASAPFYDGTTTWTWVRKDGSSGVNTFHNRVGEIRPERIRRHLPPGAYTEFRLSNLLCIGMPAKAGIAAALELARRGITIYPD